MKKIIAIVLSILFGIAGHITSQKSHAANDTGPWYLAFVLCIIALFWSLGWLITLLDNHKSK